MRVKSLLICVCLLYILAAKSQVSNIHTFGEPTEKEYSLNSYASDPDAAGVVLYERGNYTVDQADGFIRLMKEVHRKIKVFDAKNFNMSHVEIPYYRERNVQENITRLTAITHNGSVKKYVGSQAIYQSDTGGPWGLIKFTFPDIKDGSILEYTYRMESPYFSNIGSWSFMNSLPTLYSELHIEIPGNYNYNRTLHGTRKLDINHAEIKKSCFHLPGFRVPGDCEVATYAMKNIPAFKNEKHMLSANNYTPILNFELAEFIKLDQTRTVFSKSWKGVDKHFRDNNDLGRQLRFSNYFKRNLPDSILSIANDLDRAKAVYYYIQSKINWNERSYSLGSNRVKDAFEDGVGNSSEINLALINALEAAGLDAKIMAIATRDRALPTKEHPVITDFNYVIVFLEVAGQKYLLDASERYSQFGVLPYRALNMEGRVFDFKKGSYWEPIVGVKRNMHYINMRLEANPQGEFFGNVKEMSTGKIALTKRRKNNRISNQEIEIQKQSANENIDISGYQIENKSDLEQAYIENYSISLQNQNSHDRYFLYPFLMQNYFSENPFSQRTRKYPIEMGIPVTNNYLVSIDVKDHYEIVKVPSNRILKLPGNDGEISVVYEAKETKINVRLNVQLNTTSYPPEANQSLNEFFDLLMRIQSQEPIELKRI